MTVQTIATGVRPTVTNRLSFLNGPRGGPPRIQISGAEGRIHSGVDPSRGSPIAGGSPRIEFLVRVGESHSGLCR